MHARTSFNAPLLLSYLPQAAAGVKEGGDGSLPAASTKGQQQQQRRIPTYMATAADLEKKVQGATTFLLSRGGTADPGSSRQSSSGDEGGVGAEGGGPQSMTPHSCSAHLAPPRDGSVDVDLDAAHICCEVLQVRLLHVRQTTVWDCERSHVDACRRVQTRCMSVPPICVRVYAQTADCACYLYIGMYG